MRNYQLNKEKISKIIKAVNEDFDNQLGFLIELVNIPSLRGQEATAQDLMARSFRDEGLNVDRWQIDLDDIRHLPGFSPVHQSYDNAWNVVGIHRSENPKGRSLILNGHIDVVPTGPLDMWSRPPFDAYIENGWLYGRGAGDMKAGLVCNLFALKALRKLGYQPAADLFMQSVVEEECTGNGTLACLQRGYRAEAALISEPHDDMLGRAQMGVIWLQVELKGKPAHAALADIGFNAIEATFPYISALKMLEAKWNSEKHPEYAHRDHPINFVLSKIEGGDWTSSVPSWCTFDIRMSIYPGTTVAEAQEEIEAVIAEVTSRNANLAQNPPKLTYHGFLAEGYVLERGSDAEAVLRAVHEEVYQQPIEEMVSTATNDSKFFGLYQKIPAIVYGPLCQNDHGFDERVNVESVRKITQTLALFIASWCGLEKIG